MKQLDRSKELPNDGLIVQAWIQMGCARREVTFLVTKAEPELVKDNPSLSLESYIEVTRCWTGSTVDSAR